MAPSRFANVDAYIATFPQDLQKILKTVRQAIRAAAPDAKEVIGYNMPAYKLHGWVIGFAAFKQHFSLFGATGHSVKEFKKELAGYEIGKGTIRFRYDKPVPVALIKKLTKFRAKENVARERLNRK